MKRIAALILFACMATQAQAAFTPFVVSDIRIDGLERISAGTALTYLTVEKGDTLTQEKVQKAVRALFQTGFFKDVAFDRQGDILVIKVQERPAISKITLRGNKDIKSDDLLKGLKSMGMAEGQTFDRMSLDRMQQELIRQYYNRGKYNVSVEPHVVNLDRNRVSVDIEVHEGKAARIKRINIVGNKTYTDKQIRQSFESSTSNWTSWYSKDDQYSSEKLSGDLENLSNYYLNRGYADFSIDSTQVTISPDKRAMYITADVEEGDKYTISDVKLLGNLVLPEATIKKMVLVKEGQDFSHSLMEVSKKGIVALLSNIGYAFAEVATIPRLDRTDHTVDMSFYVKPGPRVYVRRINFTGNASTRDNVARREMRQFEGGWYSQAAVDRSRSRLLRTGYFKSVDIDTKKVPGSQDQVDLQIIVEEQSAGSLQFGLGYSQLSGIIGTFSVSQNNFLGTGNQFSANIQRSSYLQQYGVSYLDPYLTDSGVSVGYNLQWSELNQGNANIADYLYSNRSFDTTFGIPLSENNSISLGLGIASNNISGYQRLGSPPFLVDYINELGHSTIHSWNGSVGWARDTRDRFFLPSRGGSQSISARVALPGSTVEFYKLFYNINHYWRLPKGFVLFTSGTTGYGDTYGKSKDLALPFWQNYYAGGVSDVRGYRDNTLGPRTPTDGGFRDLPIGGAFKVLAKTELYFPIPALQNSTTARVGAFLDVGNVFTDFNSYSSSELRASAGLTMQWRAPIGPISISIAQPLRSNDSDREYIERIQFTFGSQF